MKSLKKIITISIITLFSIVPMTVVSAQSTDLRTSNLNVDEKFGLEAINIPLFGNFIKFDTTNASIFSWLAFAGALVSIGFVIFWIFLLVRAGLKAVRSLGNAEELGEAYKKVQSVFLGAIITMMFPLVLSIIGAILGIGSIFSWPKMFEFCNYTSGDAKYTYYFQAYLSVDEKATPGFADANCGKAP